jgi:histidine triad (HIT) family protein
VRPREVVSAWVQAFNQAYADLLASYQKKSDRFPERVLGQADTLASALGSRYRLNDLPEIGPVTPAPMFEVPKVEPCSLCQDLDGRREVAIVAENGSAVAIVNERQYERGSVLVVPRVHRETVLDIEAEEIAGVYQLVREVAKAAALAFSAVGMSIFQNNGVKAGQSQPHYHVHVVPRYETSDPDQRFLERDFEVFPIAEQRALADRIGMYL